MAYNSIVATDKKVLTEPLQKLNFFCNLKDEGNTRGRVLLTVKKGYAP